MLLTTVVVDTVADVLDGDTQSIEDLLSSPGADGKISLREAIVAANHGGQAPSLQQVDPGFNGTTITFDPSLTANGDATISLIMFDVADEQQSEVFATTVFQPMSEYGPTAFVITSSIEILGTTGDNGITIQRAANAPDFRLFHVDNYGSLTLANLTLADGVARGGDGASGDGASGGGAILNEGSLRTENSTLVNNQAIGGNGSVHPIGEFGGGGGGGDGLGGAIFNLGGFVGIVNSTVSGNTAQGGLGAAGSGDDAAGTDGSGLGGGLFNLNGLVELINATIANSAAEEGGESVYNLWHDHANSIPSSSEARVVLRNTILDDSVFGSDLINEQRPGDGAAIIEVGGPTLVETEPRNFSGTILNPENFIGVDPLLGPLADNGGPTRTHLPGVGSPAIDRGDNASANEITNPNIFGLTFLGGGDQRNFQRIVDGDDNETSTVDLGAVEVGGTQLPAVELDEFSNAFLTVMMDIGGGPQQLLLEGETRHVTVFDGPQLGRADDSAQTVSGRDDLQSYLFGEFEGYSPTLGWVTVQIVGQNGAIGGIEEASNGTPGRLDLPPFGAGTASSFFDVFINVNTQLGRLHNDTPIHVSATVHAKPAAAGDLFLFVAGEGTPIVLFNDQDQQAAALSRVEYTPIPRLDFGDAPEVGTSYATTLIREVHGTTSWPMGRGWEPRSIWSPMVNRARTRWAMTGLEHLLTKTV